MKKPNVPMNNAITTCRHKVDKKKFEEGWDRIWGKKNTGNVIPETNITFEEVQQAARIMDEMDISASIRNDIAKQIAESITEKQEELISDAISKFLDNEDWKIEDVLPRIHWEVQEGREGKRLIMDGRMILEIMPPLLHSTEETITCHVDYRSA